MKLHNLKQSLALNLMMKLKKKTVPGVNQRKESARQLYMLMKNGKKLEKSLSSKQRDNVMLQIMKEDLALKKKSMTADESNKSADANAMIKIADSMQMLSRAIMTGFNHLVAVNQSNQQPFPQQYPVQGT